MPVKLSRKAAEAALASASADRRRLSRYRCYWRSIAPRDDLAYFRRWLFAFASVQTGWQRNVVIYNRLAAPDVRFHHQSLRRVLRECGAGMLRVRSIGISRFHRDYWADPSW